MMKKTGLSILCLLLVAAVVGQATFVISSLPAETPGDDTLYMAGDFTNWDPGNDDYRLSLNDDNKWAITLEGFEEGTAIQYKFTRGSWETVEKGPYMEEIPNRLFTFGNGQTIEVDIANWADFGDGGGGTASWNVHILSDSFYMPQLDRYRRIWVYTPPGYDSVSEHYPVIYMHDGQNLFDIQTAFAEEWEVDETLNGLHEQGYRVPVVIGIDNGGEYRIDELTPWEFSYGGGQGAQYIDFIKETLKPYIDDHYRTLPGPEHTGLIGSSLGGLISAYGALKYQDVFGRSGPMSPAYWVNNDSLTAYLAETGKQEDIKFYQSIGTDEGANNIALMHDFEDSLRSAGFDEVLSVEIEGAGHNEATWRDDFASAYLWLFGAYALDVKEYTAFLPLKVYPNPAGDAIRVAHSDLPGSFEMTVWDSTGRRMVETPASKDAVIDISRLPAGVYVVKVDIDGRAFLGKFMKN